jgi:hypothetical protein
VRQGTCDKTVGREVGHGAIEHDQAMLDPGELSFEICPCERLGSA